MEILWKSLHLLICSARILSSNPNLMHVESLSLCKPALLSFDHNDRDVDLTFLKMLQHVGLHCNCKVL